MSQLIRRTPTCPRARVPESVPRDNTSGMAGNNIKRPGLDWTARRLTISGIAPLPATG